MMANGYRILCNSISTRNSRASAIVERVHQIVGDIIQTFNIQEINLGNEKPWEGILLSILFTIWSIMHTTIQHTLSQMVFGRDAILNINQEANRQFIKQRKQVFIKKGNQKENRHWQYHVYLTQSLILRTLGK